MGYDALGALADQFKGNQGDKDAPTETVPLWKRLFHLGENEGGGIHPAAFQMPGDWAGALKSPGAGDSRGLEGVIERGTLAALRDFAAEQKPAPKAQAEELAAASARSGPRSRPAAEGALAALAAALVSLPQTVAPVQSGGPASSPMGSLGGKPQGVESIGAAAGGKATGWWTPERQKHAVEYLKNNAGLSDMGARGLVSRWANVEAARGPGEVNPRSGAAGIGQWLGDRKHGFKLGDFDFQLAHAARELNTSEKGAGDALRNARTAMEAATGASRYERAEGFNPRTGRDNFTNKTAAGIAGYRRRWRAALRPRRHPRISRGLRRRTCLASVSTATSTCAAALTS